MSCHLIFYIGGNSVGQRGQIKSEELYQELCELWFYFYC
jgi:hypothetical protein